MLKTIGKPTTAWLAPGEPGYSETIGQQYKFDATKAKKILSDASIDPKSLGAKLTFVNSGDGPAIAQAIQAQMRQNLGVELQLDPQESKVYDQLVSDQKNYQLTTGGWGADYPDPQDWLPELFGTNGGNNSYNYSNPKVDALFQQAAVEQDNTKRLALYNQAEQIIVDTDCAVGPIYNREWFYVHKPNPDRHYHQSDGRDLHRRSACLPRLAVHQIRPDARTGDGNDPSPPRYVARRLESLCDR